MMLKKRKKTMLAFLCATEVEAILFPTTYINNIDFSLYNFNQFCIDKK